MKRKGMLLILTVVIATGAALCAPVAAMAQGTPGDSSIDQYVPSIPGADGDEALDSGDGSGGSSSGEETNGSVPPATADELEGEGATGAAVSALVEETGVADASGQDQGRNDASKSDDSGAEGGGSLGDLASAAVSGEGGMGLAFPLILLATAIGAILLALARRREDTDSPS